MKAATALIALALSMTLFSVPASAGSIGLDYGDLRVGSVLPGFLRDAQLDRDDVTSCKHRKKDEEKEDKEEKPKEGVPEIDAVGAGVALALLGGILLLWHERRRSRR